MENKKKLSVKDIMQKLGTVMALAILVIPVVEIVKLIQRKLS